MIIFDRDLEVELRQEEPEKDVLTQKTKEEVLISTPSLRKSKRRKSAQGKFL